MTDGETPLGRLAREDASCGRAGREGLSRRVRAVSRRLRRAYQRLAAPADRVPAGTLEWFSDNWFAIAEALHQVAQDLPPHFARDLPRRRAAPAAGQPRVLRLARAISDATGDFLDLGQAASLVAEYQEVTPLTIGELWALPALLRLVVLEQLADSAERVVRGDRAATGEVETRVAGCISSLRRIAAHNWKIFVERASRLEALLRDDPAGAHATADFETRDRTRKAAEQVARWAGTDQPAVARAVLAAARQAPPGSRAAHVGHYLLGAGRPALERALGCRTPPGVRLRRAAERHATALYLGTIGLLAAALLAAPLAYFGRGEGVLVALAVAALALVPALGIAVPVVNWLVTHTLPPRRLPKLDFDERIPPACRTVVAVPTLLADRADADAMLRQLEVNYQGNADPAIRFALLLDGPDADTPERPDDQALLAAVTAGIAQLNRRYGGAAPGGSGPFLALWRPRRWNAAEGRWMGWERKRGKLTEFNRLLLGAGPTDLAVHAGDPAALRGVRYVITLDADTVLPGGAAAQLIGALAHPLNAATFDAAGRIEAGYTVLQPRVVVAGRGAGATAFARVFEGDSGLDLYTPAISDAYHDLFGEGIFAGKGIYDVAAFERSLAGRVPDNALLSHDLFEGIHGRAGFISDVQVQEDYPSHVIGYARRLHRWVRGDWQLLPWLGRTVPLADGSRGPTPLSLIDRWKIVDNLRRSLMAPAILVLMLVDWLLLPDARWFLTAIAAGTLGVPILLGAATSANRIVAGAAWRPTVDTAVRGMGMDALRWLLAIMLLAFEAALIADAVGRTLARLLVTRRHLLEWQPAALTAQAVARARGAGFTWRQMMASPLIGLTGAAGVLLVAPVSLPVALPFLLLWMVAPGVAHLMSRPRVLAVPILSAEERWRLRRLARRTWHYFEAVLSPDHNWLPPDNLQEAPVATVAHRTSPTNVGMGLLATLAAYDLGYLGLRSLASTLSHIMRGLGTLERFRGHFYNWCDTRTGAVLTPRYVSVVDSGNLAAALMTVRQACRELEDAPAPGTRLWEGLRDTQSVLRHGVELAGVRRADARAFQQALDALDALVRTPPAGLPAQRALAEAVRREHIPALESALAALVEQTIGVIDAVHLRDLRLWMDRLRYQADRILLEFEALAPEAAQAVRDQLRQVAAEAGAMVDAMDFAFLYDGQRRLFHIGYDVDAGRLDESYYDLLASEARLASLVAIAKRDVAERHWLHLGRPFGRVRGRRVLLSWGGTMFEYLMPALLAETPAQSLLARMSRVAVDQQRHFARRHGIPWGTSESAFHVLNAEGHYQYRAFGVPGLGLKRELGDRLVVAPYACVLALPVAPREVAANVERLEQLGALGAYGLYEALDFGIPPAAGAGQVVRAYMSHHQGMMLAALANHLTGRPMVRRFHRDPRVASIAYLLFEQAPRYAPVYRPAARLARPRGLLRARYASWGVAGTGPPQLHLLSNGRFSTLLTREGGGGSRWRGRALTRWRAESGVNQWGHWCYVRDRDGDTLWSAAAQPVNRFDAVGTVRFSASRAEYRMRAQEIATRMVVTVPPGDDVEIRRITVRNESRATRRLTLTSCCEIALARPGDDLRHQAFTKLFVESEILAPARTLLFRRRPGGPDRDELFLGQRLAVRGDSDVTCTWETDRARFYGPGGSARRPAALAGTGALSGTAGATLDPVAVIACDFTLAPGAEIALAFVTGAAAAREELLTRLDAYQHWSRIDRAFEQAAVHAETELAALGIAPDELPTIQRLFSALLAPDAALRPASALTEPHGTQAGLWPFGISGDRPILLLRAGHERDEALAVIRTALRCYALLRGRGCAIDVVLLDELSGGYLQPFHERLDALVQELDLPARPDMPPGVFVVRGRDLPAGDRTLLEAAARVVLDTVRPIGEQLDARDAEPTRLPPFVPTQAPPRDARPPRADAPLTFANGLGGFADGGREYVIRLEPGAATPRAWAHVVANPAFGFVATALGGGYTWSVNSGERRLTPWRNDPVSDAPGEALYLRDEETGAVWSPTPLPAGATGPHTARFGAGYASWESWHAGLDQLVRMSVAPAEPVKCIEVTLSNTTARLRRLTLTYYVEWVLGTSRHRSGPHLVPEYDALGHALLAHNPMHPVFAGRTAFLTASEPIHGFTADRAEFLGGDDSYAWPAALGRIGPSGVARAGGDVCGAIQVYVQLEPGERRTVHFALGDGADRADAVRLAARYRDPVSVWEAADAGGKQWDALLGAVQVRTPDQALDLLLNRWLLYQATACRLWARTGLDQSSGAFGFRDQLQDVLALTAAAPGLARAQLLEAARHQFTEGDVLHWWHPGSDAGVRTRCSDDLLWLPFATAQYVAVTGDHAVLDAPVPFLSAAPLAEDEDDRYDHFPATTDTAPLYEHCVRALRQGHRPGAHGLPLFGTGDWNDGMNRVGAEGRGESVWLAWFFIATARRFAPLSAARGDAATADRLTRQADAMAEAVERHAWDGGWYRRGSYDDGAPLGASESTECRLDAVAQSWAVISGAADPARARAGMRAVLDQLADPELELLRLFDPPFDRPARDPGYIRAYPPGVRENGGQYTHAAVWTAWAVGLLGDGDRLGALLRWLNPVHRTSTPAGVARYRGEPYAVAADIATAPLRRGVAGWTWYTGSAAWLYRLGLEVLLGVTRAGEVLHVNPCIPRDWDGFEVTWRHGEGVYILRVRNPDGVCRGVRTVTVDGVPQADGRIRLSPEAGTRQVEVVLGEL